MKIFNQKDIQKVEAAIKEQEVTAREVEFETPFYYELELNNDVKIMMEVKQLTFEEYQSYFFYHNYISLIMSKIELETIDIKEFKKLNQLVFYLTRLSRCLNPEVFMNKEIVNAYNAKYIDDIAKKDLYVLFTSLIDICNKSKLIELDYYKRYSECNNIKRRLAFSFHEYNRFKRCSSKYIKYLAKIVIDYYIAQILVKVEFKDIIDIFNRVLLYNTYIKKKLLNAKEEIYNRTADSGKRIHTLGNYSTVTIGESYLTLE